MNGLSSQVGVPLAQRSSGTPTAHFRTVTAWAVGGPEKRERRHTPPVQGLGPVDGLPRLRDGPGLREFVGLGSRRHHLNVGYPDRAWLAVAAAAVPAAPRGQAVLQADLPAAPQGPVHVDQVE